MIDLIIIFYETTSTLILFQNPLRIDSFRLYLTEILRKGKKD